MKTTATVIRHGRYRIGETFARRLLAHYSRRVRHGDLPSPIAADLTDPGKFSRAVNAKTAHLLDRFASTVKSGDPERDLHAAFTRIAGCFGLPEPATPQWSKPVPLPGDQPTAPAIDDAPGLPTTKPGTGSSFAGDGNTPALLDDEAARESFNRIIDRQHPLPVPHHPVRPTPWNQFQPESHAIDTGGSSQLVARMREELMSVSRHRRFRDRDTGSVDTDTKLPDLAAGVNLDHAFYSVTHARRINTAVQLIIDVSGSMRGGCFLGIGGRSKIVTAVTCAVLICDCLERLQVPVEVLAFSEHATCVKPWHEKMHTARSKISRLRTLGSTNLPAAMTAGMASLGPRREERQIQAVIIDGDLGNTDQIRSLKKSAPKLRTFCFGVGVTIPAGVFDRTLSNLTTENMVGQILDQLRAALKA